MLGSDIAKLSAQMMRKLRGWESATRVLHGFRVDVVNSRPDIETEQVFRRIDAALALIARYQPRTFRRMQHDIARILVQRYPCRGAYFPDSRTCLTELTFSVNPEFVPAQIAASMVHEGMHARVRTMCSVFVPEQLPREERLCRKAELHFGLSVPGGEPVVERALASLALSDQDVAPAIDWNEAQRRVSGADAAGRSSGDSME